jgi:hypothetical protein
MEKSTKQEYVAVPTTDVEEATLPPYQEENPADKSIKRKDTNLNFNYLYPQFYSFFKYIRT